jgi:acyl-CoA thioester hydrolase
MTVRWGDMDAIGHVNNVEYFRYGESGRIAYFDRLEAEDPTFWKEHGIILASMHCDFLAQVKYPAELEVCTRVARLGGSSLDIAQAIYQQDRLVATLKAVMVWFDYKAQKTLRIPEHVRAWIRAREAVPPQE